MAYSSTPQRKKKKADKMKPAQKKPGQMKARKKKDNRSGY